MNTACLVSFDFSFFRKGQSKFDNRVEQSRFLVEAAILAAALLNCILRTLASIVLEDIQQK